jgi:hypothetical protein
VKTEPDIFDDIAAGEDPIALTTMGRKPWAGRKHTSFYFRAKDDGLEVAKIGTLVTTKSAWLRYLRRKTSGTTGAAKVRTPARREREVGKKETELTAAGW